jgi:uncharacterized RDD family membrane protein YckC
MTELTNSDELPTAGLRRRLAALIYDTFLLFALTLAYGALLLIIKILFKTLVNSDGLLEEIQIPAALQWLSFLGWLLVLGGYYFICWRKQGQTLGMKAWRVRLQQTNGPLNAQGMLVTTEQCIKRSLLAPFSLALCGMGYLWIMLPSARGCLHDIVTGTEVVLLPKDK